MTAPPCDPATLRGPCVCCGRPLHTTSRHGPRRACADGHPRHEGHDLCGGCTKRRHERRPGTPQPTVRDQGWSEHAACRDADPNLFFPDLSPGAHFRPIVEPVARQYCGRCPVRDDCDIYAQTTTPPVVGLWGGRWRRWRGSTPTATPLLDEAVAS